MEADYAAQSAFLMQLAAKAVERLKPVVLRDDEAVVLEWNVLLQRALVDETDLAGLLHFGIQFSRIDVRRGKGIPLVYRTQGGDSIITIRLREARPRTMLAAHVPLHLVKNIRRHRKHPAWHVVVTYDERMVLRLQDQLICLQFTADCDEELVDRSISLLDAEDIILVKEGIEADGVGHVMYKMDNDPGWETELCEKVLASGFNLGPSDEVMVWERS